jgi:RNA polymerase sigma-70 factor (ECF subfamily)
MDERELVRRARKGDREAFGELVRLYQARLRAFAARLVPRSEDVFDIVQDAFIDALRNIHRFDPAQELGPWLRAICRNRILNFFRSQRVRRAAGLALVDQAVEETLGEDEWNDPLAGLKFEALQECVDGLDESARTLIDLRYHQNLPLGELARRVGRSPAALSMALFRIRGALLRCMERRMEALTP